MCRQSRPSDIRQLDSKMVAERSGHVLRYALGQIVGPLVADAIFTYTQTFQPAALPGRGRAAGGGCRLPSRYFTALQALKLSAIRPEALRRLRR